MIHVHPGELTCRMCLFSIPWLREIRSAYARLAKALQSGWRAC